MAGICVALVAILASPEDDDDDEVVVFGAIPAEEQAGDLRTNADEDIVTAPALASPNAGTMACGLLEACAVSPWLRPLGALTVETLRVDMADTCVAVVSSAPPSVRSSRCCDSFQSSQRISQAGCRFARRSRSWDCVSDSSRADVKVTALSAVLSTESLGGDRNTVAPVDAAVVSVGAEISPWA